jgi:predicted metal-dependent hydrolase
VLPTLPLRVRNRLASAILAALGDEDARRALRALASDDTAARAWLAPEEDQLTAAVRERARRAAGALTDRPPLAAETDLGQALQAAGLLFDAGLHFEVHEVLEPHWMSARGEAREVLQGLIQVAVAYQHLANGNHAGARSLLVEGSGRLHARALAGVDLDPFAHAAAAAAERVATGQPVAVPSFPRFSRSEHAARQGDR